jgi:hypothetical protein
MPRLRADTTCLGDRVTPVAILPDHTLSSEIGIATLPGTPPSRRAQEFSTVLDETVREIYFVEEPVPADRPREGAYQIMWCDASRK